MEKEDVRDRRQVDIDIGIRSETITSVWYSGNHEILKRSSLLRFVQLFDSSRRAWHSGDLWREGSNG